MMKRNEDLKGERVKAFKFYIPREYKNVSLLEVPS